MDMKCPVDNTTLQVAQRSGVEIDYCPRCRGVWLDRGELEKLIQADTASYDSYDRAESRHDDHHDSRRADYGRSKRARAQKRTRRFLRGYLWWFWRLSYT